MQRNPNLVVLVLATNSVVMRLLLPNAAGRSRHDLAEHIVLGRKLSLRRTALKLRRNIATLQSRKEFRQVASQAAPADGTEH